MLDFNLKRKNKSIIQNWLFVTYFASFQSHIFMVESLEPVIRRPSLRIVIVFTVLPLCASRDQVGEIFLSVTFTFQLLTVPSFELGESTGI
jgi:hypothetical protein